MSKIMTWHIWEVTYLCRYVTMVCGASYHLLGSQISQDLKIRFQLRIKSYISDWQFSKLQHLASYFSRHNAMAYDKHVQSIWSHRNAVHRYTVAASHSHTHSIRLIFWGSGSLMWIQNDVITSWLMLAATSNCLPSSIVDIYKVFEHIIMLSIDILSSSLKQFNTKY
jgi:hypothetical protein